MTKEIEHLTKRIESARRIRDCYSSPFPDGRELESRKIQDCFIAELEAERAHMIEKTYGN